MMRVVISISPVGRAVEPAPLSAVIIAIGALNARFKTGETGLSPSSEIFMVLTILWFESFAYCSAFSRAF